MSSVDRTKKQAVALSYDLDGDGPPKVVAAGDGEVAQRIIKAAEDAGVPVREDDILSSALRHLAVGEHIPQDVYIAVAEILVWAWKTDRSLS